MVSTFGQPLVILVHYDYRSKNVDLHFQDQTFAFHSFPANLKTVGPATLFLRTSSRWQRNLWFQPDHRCSWPSLSRSNFWNCGVFAVHTTGSCFAKDCGILIFCSCRTVTVEDRQLTANRVRWEPRSDYRSISRDIDPLRLPLEKRFAFRQIS